MTSIYKYLVFGILLICGSIASFAQYSEIWGTSYTGGNDDAGYIFRMDADGGSFDKVHHFEGGIHGQWPNGALTEGPDGKLYGITAQGGEFEKGVIYSYNRQYDVFTVEYHPNVNLGQKFLLAPDGKFYINSTQSRGSLYTYDPVTRSLDLVYDYAVAEGRSSFTEGSFLLVDDHRIIGTTYSGGSMDDGVLFEYDLNTSTWTVLHSFGGSEGRAPSPTLALLGRKLYGTTIWGAANGRGALFEYDLNTSTFTKKTDFTAESSRAEGPGVGPDGKIYLQSPTGGNDYHGGLLRFDPSTDDFDLIHTFFEYGTSILTGSMYQTWEGRLFGVSRYGGSGSGLGTIYEVNVAAENISVRQSFNDGFPINTRLLEVGERAVSSVVIQAPALTIDSDDGTLLLDTVLLPSEAADQPVVWAVNNPSVATINSDGLLTAAGNGTVRVTATANFGEGVSDSIDIVVSNQNGTPPQIPVDTIVLSSSRVYLTSFGSTQQVYADTFPNNASNSAVTWASLDNSVATVSSSGLIQAVGAGTTSVTATATDGSGTTASTEVEVTQLITGLTITPNTSVIDTFGETVDFDVIVTPANATNPEVTWSINTNIADIDQDGVLTPQGNGEVIVTATAEDGSEVTATRTVTMSNQYVVVQVVNIFDSGLPSWFTRTTITADLGTIQMTGLYSPLDSTNPTLTWTSTKPSVATVDQNGLVTAVSNGKTIIRATSADGPSDTHEFWTFDQSAGPITLSSIELTPPTPSINERASTVQMTATPIPVDAAEIDFSWQVFGDAGTISQDGVVTGVENGDVQVRAYTQDVYGRDVYSSLVTVTLTNQDDPIARIEPEFNIVEGKARLTYTRFVPDSGVTLTHQGTSDLSQGWTNLVLDTHYTVHTTTNHGDGTETLVLELIGDAPDRYFLKVSAEQE